VECSRNDEVRGGFTCGRAVGWVKGEEVAVSVVLYLFVSLCVLIVEVIDMLFLKTF